MKFSLPAAIVLFSAASTLAFPQAGGPDSGIITRDADGLDLSQVDIEDVEIDYNPDDFMSLNSRATIHCANSAKIKRVKKEYKGKCNPANSGNVYPRGAHNCKTKDGGKSYLCVQGNKATCYSISDAMKKNLESGECFIRK